MLVVLLLCWHGTKLNEQVRPFFYDEFEASQASSQKKSETKRNIIYDMTWRHQNGVLD